MQLTLEAPTTSGSSHLADVPAHWENTIKLGELFCGAGGMALGASQAKHNGWGFEHAWVTDIDRDSCQTIRQVVENPQNIIKRDVKDIDFEGNYIAK